MKQKAFGACTSIGLGKLAEENIHIAPDPHPSQLNTLWQNGVHMSTPPGPMLHIQSQ